MPWKKIHRLRDSQPLHLRAVASGTFTGIAVLSLLSIAGLSLALSQLQDERVRVILEASTVKAAIESGVNERISLERGIVAFVASNPGLEAAAYSEYAAALMVDDPAVINLAVLEGTVIKFVYPLGPNKAAIGRDLALVPEQAESTRRAMTTRDAIVSGPVSLVQGGVGIVSRMGIFLTGPKGPEYWGQASVVIDSDMLFKRAGVLDRSSLRMALEFKNAGSSLVSTYFGNREILGEKPVILPVTLPGVDWAILAVPRDGWAKRLWVWAIASALGLALAGAAGFAVYSLLTTRAALKEMAYHDQLTELPNRSLFWDRLRVATNQAERMGQGICVCMVDLDDFKMVNDELGHEAGDGLLIAASARMAAALRKCDTVARFGGDEFAVIAVVDGQGGVEEVTARIRSCFVEPFKLGAVSRVTSASIGTALFPADSNDIETILTLADERMYHIKRARIAAVQA